MLQPGRCTPSMSAPKPRRGHSKAIVATARKLAILFWCMLTRVEDYAHQQPSLTRKKLRRLEITAGAPKYTRRGAGIWSTNDLMRDRRTRTLPASRGLLPADRADQLAGRPTRKWARARHRSAHRSGPQLRGQSRAADQAPDVCSSLRHSPAPNQTTYSATPTLTTPRRNASPANTDQHLLDFHRSIKATALTARRKSVDRSRRRCTSTSRTMLTIAPPTMSTSTTRARALRSNVFQRPRLSPVHHCRACQTNIAARAKQRQPSACLMSRGEEEHVEHHRHYSENRDRPKLYAPHDLVRVVVPALNA